MCARKVCEIIDHQRLVFLSTENVTPLKLYVSKIIYVRTYECSSDATKWPCGKIRAKKAPCNCDWFSTNFRICPPTGTRFAKCTRSSWITWTRTFWRSTCACSKPWIRWYTYLLLNLWSSCAWNLVATGIQLCLPFDGQRLRTQPAHSARTVCRTLPSVCGRGFFAAGPRRDQTGWLRRPVCVLVARFHGGRPETRQCAAKQEPQLHEVHASVFWLGLILGMFRLTENSVNRCFRQNRNREIKNSTTETETDKKQQHFRLFSGCTKKRISFEFVLFLSNLLNFSYFTLFWFHLKSALKNHHFSVWNTIFSKCNKLLHMYTSKMQYSTPFHTYV